MNYLVYIFVALVPFIIADELWDYSNLPKTLFIQNGVILLAVVFFWTRKLRKFDMKVSRTLIAYMVFLAWAGLSILWAVNKYEAVIIFTHWATCGMFLFLVQNLNINRTIMFTILLLTAWTVALIGLGQHFFHLDWVLQSARPASVFANKNLASAYILMILPIGVALMVSVCRRRIGKDLIISLLVSFIILATMLTYLYVAEFRTAFLIVPIIGTYYLVRYLRKTAYTDYALLIPVLAVLIVASYFYVKPEVFHKATESRFQIWRNTGEIIKKHPIVGVGIGNFRVHYDKYSDIALNTNEPHNDYIQVFCELGIVGLYFAFLVIAYAFWGAQKEYDLYSAGLKVGLVVFLILAMAHFPLQKATGPYLSALYLGMLKV